MNIKKILKTIAALLTAGLVNGYTEQSFKMTTCPTDDDIGVRLRGSTLILAGILNTSSTPMPYNNMEWKMYGANTALRVEEDVDYYLNQPLTSESEVIAMEIPLAVNQMSGNIVCKYQPEHLRPAGNTQEFALTTTTNSRVYSAYYDQSRATAVFEKSDHCLGPSQGYGCMKCTKKSAKECNVLVLESKNDEIQKLPDLEQRTKTKICNKAGFFSSDQQLISDITQNTESKTSSDCPACECNCQCNFSYAPERSQKNKGSEKGKGEKKGHESQRCNIL